jgi:hypothetical protein
MIEVCHVLVRVVTIATSMVNWNEACHVMVRVVTIGTSRVN